jgi:hypothetical protein
VVRAKKRENLQNAKQQVKCEGAKLKNVHKFKFLGSIFTSNGEHMTDLR